MSLRDSAANRESDPRALVLLFSMEALENRENLIEILFVKADAIIGDRQNTTVTLYFGSDFDHWRETRAMEFKRVRYYVLEELPHLRRVGINRRELLVHGTHRTAMK